MLQWIDHGRIMQLASLEKISLTDVSPACLRVGVDVAAGVDDELGGGGGGGPADDSAGCI